MATKNLTFVAADNTLLTSYTSDGCTFSQLYAYGDVASAAVIRSNNVSLSRTDSGRAYIVDGIVGVPNSIAATIDVLDILTYPYHSVLLFLRISDSTHYYYTQFGAYDGNIYLVGRGTVLASTPHGLTVGSSRIVSMTAEDLLAGAGSPPAAANCVRLKVFVGGVEKLSYDDTDAARQLTGDAGIGFDVGGSASGVGPSGEVLTALTIDYTATEGTTPPATPDDLTNTAVTGTTATYTWSASTDDVAVTGYKIKWEGGSAVDVGSVLTYTKTGLTYGTAYATGLQVAAYDAANNLSSYSTAVPATTSALAAPTLIQRANVTTSCITLIWVNGAAYDFVEARINGGAAFRLGDSYAGDIAASAWVFRGLDPDTDYTIEVRGDIGGGKSAWLSLDESTFALPTPINVMTPGGSWNGTALSGGTPPADASRTTYKAAGKIDQVPYQRMVVGAASQKMKVCVIADAVSDITGVDFWFEGRTLTVTDVTRNEYTGAWGYCITLDVSAVTIGGIAWLYAQVNSGGQARLLTLPVIIYKAGNANGVPAETYYTIDADSADGSPDGTDLHPFASVQDAVTALTSTGGALEMSGVHLRLKAASAAYSLLMVPSGGGIGFSWKQTYDWMTVEQHPDVPGAKITGSIGGTPFFPVNMRIRLPLVSQSGDTGYWAAGSGSGSGLWVDGCDILGPGPTVDLQIGPGSFGFWPGFDLLNSRDCNALGITWAVWYDNFGQSIGAQNCAQSASSGDIFRLSSVAQVFIQGHRLTGAQHGDGWHIESLTWENLIAQNVYLDLDAATFPTSIRTSWTGAGNILLDAAWQNVVFNTAFGDSLNMPMEHFVLRHVTNSQSGPLAGLSLHTMGISGGTSGKVWKATTTVTGGTSGATGSVVGTSNATDGVLLYLGNVVGTFVHAETLTGTASDNSGASATVETAPVAVVSTSYNRVQACNFGALSGAAGSKAYWEAHFTSVDNNYADAGWTPGTRAQNVTPAYDSDAFYAASNSITQVARTIAFDVFGNPRAAMTAPGAVAAASEGSPLTIANPTLISLTSSSVTASCPAASGGGGDYTYELLRNGVDYSSASPGTNTIGGYAAATSVIFGWRVTDGLGATASGTLTVTTTCAAPASCSATKGDTQATISWPSVFGANTYTVLRDGTPVQSGIVGTSYTDTSLTNGQTYVYTVKAVGANSQASSASPSASVTPNPRAESTIGVGLLGII